MQFEKQIKKEAILGYYYDSSRLKSYFYTSYFLLLTGAARNWRQVKLVSKHAERCEPGSLIPTFKAVNGNYSLPLAA